MAMLVALAEQPNEAHAYYGGPRFFGGQAPSRLLHNVGSDEFIITNPTDTQSLNHQLLTIHAKNTWNGALQGTPNSLGKALFDYNAVYDPAANVLVHVVPRDDMLANCGPQPPEVYGCNDVQVTTVNDIWIDELMVTSERIQHELGHTLMYDDQYYSDLHCADGQMQFPAGPHGPTHAEFNSIMDCDNAIHNDNDEVPFQSRYEPTYQSANPAYPDTWNASWNAFTGTGNVRMHFAYSEVEYRYLWEKLSDTGGSVVASGYTADSFRDFSYNLQNRFCVPTKIYNEVGYPGTRPWSPRSQYSCIGAAQSQTAGFLLSTSDRNGPGNNTLYLRVKNLTGYNRNIGIFSPTLQNIGCGYVNVGWLATRECYITLARGTYTHLNWYAFDPNNGNIYSWGYLDFE